MRSASLGIILLLLSSLSHGANITFNAPVTGFSGEMTCVDPGCPDLSVFEDSEWPAGSAVGDRFHLSDISGSVSDFAADGTYTAPAVWMATVRLYDDSAGAWIQSVSLTAPAILPGAFTITFNPPTTGFSDEMACIDPNCPDDSIFEDDEWPVGSAVGDRFHISVDTGTVSDLNEFGSFVSVGDWSGTARRYDGSAGQWLALVTINASTSVGSQPTITLDLPSAQTDVTVTATLSTAFAGNDPNSVVFATGDTIPWTDGSATTCEFTASLASMVAGGVLDMTNFGAQTITVTNGTESTQSTSFTITADPAAYTGTVACNSCPAGSIFDNPSFPTNNMGDTYYVATTVGSIGGLSASGEITSPSDPLVVQGRVFDTAWSDLQADVLGSGSSGSSDDREIQSDPQSDPQRDTNRDINRGIRRGLTGDD